MSAISFAITHQTIRDFARYRPPKIIRLLRHYCPILLIFSLLMAPLTNWLNVKTIVVNVKNGGHPLENVSIKLLDEEVTKKTDSNGRAVFRLNKGKSKILIEATHQNYKDLTTEGSGQVINLEMKRSLADFDFIHPKNQVEITDLDKIHFYVRFLDHDKKPCYIGELLENITILLNDKNANLSSFLKDKKKRCFVEFSEKYTPDLFSLGKNTIKVSFTEPHLEGFKDFILYKNYSLTKGHELDFSATYNQHVSFTETGIDFYLNKEINSNILRVPYVININKPLTVKFEAISYHPKSCIMVNIGTTHRLLIGDGDMQTIKVQQNQLNSWPPDWSTISTSKLESPISINKPMKIKITYTPNITIQDGQNSGNSLITLDILYAPTNFTDKRINSSVKFTTFLDYSTGKIEQNFGLGSICYPQEHTKTNKFWNLNITGGIM